MNHSDHVCLIEKAIQKGIWADLGSGDGAFTLALRDIAGEDIEIYSVDQDTHRLDNQKQNFHRMFPQTAIHFLHNDFTKFLDLPPLDGILMANSLHYVKEKVWFLEKIKQYLKPKGKLVIVEYNVDSGNLWVPYPLSFHTFSILAQGAGYSYPKLLGTIPSQFLQEIYSAVTHI